MKEKDTLGQQADINATPLHDAAKKGNLEEIKLLLQQGVDVNAKDKEGITPLYLAAGQGHLEVAKLLIKKGAKINIKNESGNTPLHWAAYEEQIEVVKLLIENGAKIHAKTNDGWTSVGWAAFKDNKELIKFLIEKGANPNDISKTSTAKAILVKGILVSGAINLCFTLVLILGKQIFKYYNKGILHPYYNYFLIISLLFITIFNLEIFRKLKPLLYILLRRILKRW